MPGNGDLFISSDTGESTELNGILDLNAKYICHSVNESTVGQFNYQFT